MKRLIRQLLLLFFLACPFLTFSQSDVLFILDGSGSMWQKLDDEYKVVIAKQVMKDLVDKLPDSTRAGLVAYGHNRKSDCSDIETLVPLGMLDKAGFKARLDGINPVGMTPIAGSVQHTLDLLNTHPEEVTVILVSDGLETCEGDACELVRKAKAAGVKITMHVIGFGIEEKDLSTLECIAQAGNGQYLPANSADELMDAIDKTIEEPPMEEAGGGYLGIKATLDGERLDAGIKVFKKGETKETAVGRTYTGEATNPRYLLLPAGTYESKIEAIPLDGNPTQLLKDLVITAGDTLFRAVDFSKGTFEIKVTRNGELSDAIVKLHKPGTTEEVASGRTYRREKSNPLRFEVLPGTYDVEIGAIEIAGKPTLTLENQQLEGGGIISLEHDFKSVALAVGAKKGSELVDAVVTIRFADTGKEADRGRTYMSDTSNPKSFTLKPGNYQVHLKPIKPKGLSDKTIEVELKEGEAATKWAEW